MNSNIRRNLEVSVAEREQVITYLAKVMVSQRLQIDMEQVEREIEGNYVSLDEYREKVRWLLSVSLPGMCRLAIVRDTAILRDDKGNPFIPELTIRYKGELEQDYKIVYESIALSESEAAFHRLHEGTIAATRAKTRQHMLDIGYVQEIREIPSNTQCTPTATQPGATPPCSG